MRPHQIIAKRPVKALLGAVAVLSLLAAGIGPHQAQATTASATIAVSATVLSLCTVSASALAFGNYSSNAVLDGSTSVGVTCTNGTTYTVALDNGTTSGATTATRLMAGSGSNTLGYSLYKDTSRATVWGNTVGTNTTAGTGNGSLQTLNVYGRIPASQYVAPGAYTDTVTVTLTY
ncbi:MAG: spore coat U domain-containing protein [Azospirillaceae bacterium]|nr:spore coat U domain-containing protein [Azospirillaceae bacterium]